MDLDILDATEHYKDARGFSYVAISESWKRLCLDLPDSKRVQVPLIYRQQSLKTRIHGQDVVLQVWKGNCPHAYRDLPGGIGGEVGIYYSVPGKQVPAELNLPRIDAFPAPLRPLVKSIVNRILGEVVAGVQKNVEWWWPYPDLDANIEMTFLHPDDGRPLFHADPAEPAGGYWMSRWMTYASYTRYALNEAFHRRKVPLRAQDYQMRFAVGDKRFAWDDHQSPIREL